MKKQKKILSVFLVSILVIYLVYNTIGLVMSPTDTFVVEEGTLNLEEKVEAYVIRDEVVLQGANYMNGMEKAISEGKRVAKGNAVFRYYVNGEETIKNEIAEIDKKIAEAQKSEKTIYTTDIETLKNNIRDLEEKIYKTNSVEEINNYKKEIDENTYKISSIVGDSSQSGSYLKELIEQKKKYLNKLTYGSEEVKSDYSGLVSYRIDNLESVFTTDDFSYLKTDFLNGLNLKTADLIETSNEKGKVITEFVSYLAVIMNSDTSMNANIGDKVKIELEPEQVFNAEIVKINEENQSRIIVFKINDLPEKLINYRKISASIIWWQYRGLKIPRSAIIEENGRKYVERNRAGYNVKVLVNVLQQNDSYAIIDNYSTKDLQDMGFSYDEIQNMYTIKQYDKITIKND